ncbi:MAG: hypothetical protein CMM59_13775 [Rhodospirillaceae bacterium]|nr:hypothetical protein [Rhodospirillaceae bacterium]
MLSLFLLGIKIVFLPNRDTGARWFGVSLLIISAALFWPTSNVVAGENSLLKVASGPVSKEVPTRGWIPIVSGERINPGTRIRTGAGAKAVLADGDDQFTVSPNSGFEIPVEGNSKTETTISQTLGAILFKVEKSRDGNIRLKPLFWPPL